MYQINLDGNIEEDFIFIFIILMGNLLPGQFRDFYQKITRVYLRAGCRLQSHDSHHPSKTALKEKRGWFCELDWDRASHQTTRTGKVRSMRDTCQHHYRRDIHVFPVPLRTADGSVVKCGIYVHFQP